MHKVSAIITATVAMTIASPSMAADAIDAVVVTATRTEQPRLRTGDSISVITSEQLQTQQVLSVSDVLEQTPGLTVVRNGGPGQTTTIGLRGAEAGQTLFLIDGVRINDPSTVDGQALLGDIFVNNIARIEVLRGPQSTLYGGDAIGGVINILSKRGGPTPFALTASAEGGSFDTYRLNLGTNGTIGDFDYGAAVNYMHTNGISAADSRYGNPETDGTGNLGLTANTRYHITPNVSVDLRGYYTGARTDMDGYAPPLYAFGDTPQFNKDRLLAGYTGVNVALFGGRFTNRLAMIALSTNRRYYGSYPYPSYSFIPDESSFARGTTTRFEYQGIVQVDPNNQLTFGAETQMARLKTQTFAYDPAPTSGRNRTTGYYGQWQSTLFSQLTLTGGVRYEDNHEFGGHTTVKIAGAWTPNNGTTVLRANYGDGFKAPTLYELYSQYSNPLVALAPETAHGWEAGIDQRFWNNRLRVSATWFERNTRNLIDFFSCYDSSYNILPTTACTLRATAGGYYYNVGRSHSRGLELSLHAAITDALSLDANYTNMHAIDAVTHTDLARRPHNLANLRVQWQPLRDWSVGAAMIYVGRRFDRAGGTTPLPSHITTNLYLSRRLNDQIELYGRIENLFNARYEPVAGYGAPGRAVYAGIRLHY